VNIANGSDKTGNRTDISAHAPQGIEFDADIKCFGLDPDGHRLSPP